MKISKELKNLIIAAFKAHEKEDKMLVTSDGSIFLLKAKNLAHDHAQKCGGEVTTIEREDVDDLKVTEEIEESLESDFSGLTIDEIKEFASEKGIELFETEKADMIIELELELEITETED